MQPPFGVTFLDMVQSCELRVRFERSEGYQVRRMAEARIGTAFHQTLEQLINQPIEGESAHVNATIKSIFLSNLKTLDAKSATNAREKALPANPQRLHFALSALISVYPMLPVKHAKRSAAGHQSSVDPLQSDKVVVEIEVASKNKKIRGFIDRAERRATGIHLIDYKSALRTDLPLRYQQQLKLYAALWHETFNVWPSTAEVIYPLTRKNFDVAIDPEECRKLLEESLKLVEELEKNNSYDANPGAVCQVCDFRPWCHVFWNYQAKQSDFTERFNRATLGIEGKVHSFKIQSPFQFLEIQWQDRIVEVNFNQSRFPHLSNVKVGDHLRLLDFKLQGSVARPTAIYTEYSEVFICK